MRKAIQLKITLWIEALDEPEQDFAPTARQAIDTLLQQGAGSHPELQVTLKQVSEDLLSDSDAALAQLDAKPAEASQVSAVVWVEGEDEPAHDFAQSTISALQAIIQQGSAGDATRQVTIKAIVEDNEDEADEDAPPSTVQPAPPANWFVRLQRWWAALWKK